MWYWWIGNKVLSGMGYFGMLGVGLRTHVRMIGGLRLSWVIFFGGGVVCEEVCEEVCEDVCEDYYLERMRFG